MTIHQLESAAIGRPITRAGVSFFPLYLPDASRGIDIAPGTDVIISELGDAAVPTITVANPSTRSVLLVEGETITGGQQNRVLNVSVLVPAGATVEVPVSCVEAGRWDGESRFSRGRTFATRRVRRIKNASVADSVRHRETKYSDQGAVWETIDFELDRMQVDSDTRAMHAAEALLDDAPVEQYRDLDPYAPAPPVPDRSTRLAIAADELVRTGPLRTQCGVVIAHGRRIVAVEIFATAELLAANWEALVRAALLDAPAFVEGTPSIGRAMRFVQRMAKARNVDSPGVGLGKERHLRTTRLVGQALTLQGELVHASAFALAA